MDNEEIAAATRYALRQAAVNLLNTEFLPPESAKEKRVERWMKISLAHLLNNLFEALIIPTWAMTSEVAKILKDDYILTRAVLSALRMDSQNMEGMWSEPCLIKKNSLILNYIKQYNAEQYRKKLTKINLKSPEQKIDSLITLYENFLNNLEDVANKNSAFILDCRSRDISYTTINDFCEYYESLLTSEYEKLAEKKIDESDMDKPPELPEIPARLDGPRIIEHHGCCLSMLYSFPWQSKPFAINAIPNNMLDEANNLSGNRSKILDEENKEDIKFNHIR